MGEPEQTDSLDRPEAAAVPSDEAQPDAQAHAHEIGTLLQAAILSLPESHREVLVLRDVEGLSAEEAARVVGIDQATCARIEEHLKHCARCAGACAAHRVALPPDSRRQSTCARARGGARRAAGRAPRIVARILSDASGSHAAGGTAAAVENAMSQNVGSIDRVIRIVIGIALLSLVFVGPHTLWGLVGVVPLLTAFVGFCPLYRLLGIRTHRAAA